MPSNEAPIAFDIIIRFSISEKFGFILGLLIVLIY
jgi:hypothetical protein